ncbi:NYN domain-containing protein [Paraburkholderia sp. C35]|uniref:NYN domain-containing protein n=2 Tax=unclassified Paraburkholderia TaxID=2615204 RepID=UPI000D68EAAE|nr:NYN domain-containing protein [Paraburkholderia sp. C35]
MASSQDTVSMALFCDFENVALGVRDAKYEKFDIKLVLERLLLKGSIVVKKAYCDWDRYKGFKAAMHEANFELIEIPHVRQSGKNSADIRLVVDALDLCYTKSHVNTFVIISGDSDFSPLVSKLRENAKQVIGVGVQRSTSDLLTANCDEFIFYDDLVRENQRAAAKRDNAKAAQQAAQQASKRASDGEKRKEDLETRKTKAVDLAVQTFDALASERGDSGKIWASVLKNAIKRRKPDFNETYYGFRAFGNLLEEAQSRGLLEVGRDEKSGTFVYRSGGSAVAASVESAPAEVVAPRETNEAGDEWAAMPVAAEVVDVEEATMTAASLAADLPADDFAEALPAAANGHADNGKGESRRKGRGTRKPAAKKAKKTKAERVEPTTVAADSSLPAAEAHSVAEPVVTSDTQAPDVEQAAKDAPAAKKRPSRKSTARSRRPRKAESAGDAE